MKLRRELKLRTKVEEPYAAKVIIPYTKPTPLLQTVIDCLRIQWVQPTLVRVDDGDAYWRLLRDEWAKGEEFFIVEQDVLVWPGAIADLQMCKEDWCTLPTVCHGRLIVTTLGCVKFGAELIETNPGCWDDIDPDWHYLDAHFAEKMGWPFVKPHAHEPTAAHINEIQWPDSISRTGSEGKIGWVSMENGGEPVSFMGNTDGETLLNV